MTLKRFPLLFVCLVLMFSGCTQIAPAPQTDVSVSDALAALAAVNSYVIDFEKTPADRILYSVNTTTGVVYKGTGTPNKKNILVLGKRRAGFGGLILPGHLSKVVNTYGGKRLTVVSSSAGTTPHALGGRIKVEFAPSFNPLGVNLSSFKVINITTTSAYVQVYYVNGTTKRVGIAKGRSGATQTVTLNAAGVRSIDLYSPTAYAIDDVVFSEGSSTGTTLPPDPGEAGKATLAGIDSDRDGVRDDVQRYIQLTYPNDKPTRDLLTSFTKLQQEAILGTATDAERISLEQQELELTYCLAQTQPSAFMQIQRGLLTSFYNTVQRYEVEKNKAINLPSSSYIVNDILLKNCSTAGQPRQALSAQAVYQKEIVLFINGVWNEWEDGRAAAVALERVLGKDVRFLHNQTSCCFVYDLIEVLAQKYNEPVYTWRDWVYGPEYLGTSLLAELIGELSSSYTQSTIAPDLNYFREIYNDYREQEFKIVIVAHSQGNLFANSLYNNILNDPETARTEDGICGLDVVAVATPANDTFGSGNYTTLTYDLIIGGIPSSLPGNTNNIGRSNGGLGHTLIDNYLGGNNSNTKIRAFVTSAFDQMDNPAVCSDIVVTPDELAFTGGTDAPSTKTLVISTKGKEFFFDTFTGTNDKIAFTPTGGTLNKTNPSITLSVTYTCSSEGQDVGQFSLAFSRNGEEGFVAVPYTATCEAGNVPTDGTLDPEFGNGGIVFSQFVPGNSQQLPYAAAIVSGDKILAAGQAQADFAVARYNSDGSLDTSFGNRGLVRTIFVQGGQGGQARAIALLPGGKFVAAGFSGFTTKRVVSVAVYNNNGSLDSSFGNAGIVTTSVTNGSTAQDNPNTVAVDIDGKILVGGYSRPTYSGNATWFLSRYNADGSLDSTFGNQGIIRTNLPGYSEELNAISIDGSNRIVAVGQSNGVPPEDPWQHSDFTVVRYTSDGSIDASFGDGGVVLSDFAGSDDIAYSVAIDKSGKIILAGYADSDLYNSSSRGDMAVARFTSSGVLDGTFGNGGKVKAHITGDPDSTYSHAGSVAVDSVGRILVSGIALNDFNSPIATTFALARFNTNGSLDNGFGTNGVVFTNFDEGDQYGGDDYGSTILLDSRERIVVVGQVGSARAFGIARYK